MLGPSKSHRASNRNIGSKVTETFLKGWTLPIGGGVCAQHVWIKYCFLMDATFNNFIICSIFVLHLFVKNVC